MRMDPINMCKDYHPPQQTKPRKSSIWDMPSSHRCAIIGTCIKIDDLKHAAERFKKHMQDQKFDTDYDLHSYFVSVCATKNVVSWYINKLLNHEQRQFIKCCLKLKTDAQLLQAWKAIESSDLRSLSGYFWAILSSKYASDHVKERVYGDMHMISHIAGKEEKTSKAKSLHERRILLSELEKKKRKLETRNEQIRALKTEILELKRGAQEKERASRALDDDNKKADSVLSIAKYKEKLEQQKQVIARLSQRVDSLSQESEGSRSECTSRPIPVEPVSDQACKGECQDCTQNDLCGKKVLYVGGFSRHRTRFRKMTESINGEFLYHDGGLHQSEHQLDELVRKADVIFCPLDCVSHNAMGRIKNLVKSECKDCVFLKSASLSSFKNEISRYAS